MFSQDEIKSLYKRFHQIADKYYLTPVSAAAPKINAQRYLPMKVIVDLPELRHNPFKYRVARLFGEVDPMAPFVDHSATMARVHQLMETPNARVTGRNLATTAKTCRAEARRLLLPVANEIQGLRCSFESFVEIMATFSIRAPVQLKAKVAFSIYDFDGDDFIGCLDVDCALAVIGEGQENALSDADIATVSDQIVKQMDLDDNGMLSDLQFSRLLKKTPNFAEKFSFDVVGI
jgi:Ca2+-binding EF-hand superfamily protein